jgi:hypothetical protein
VNAASETLSDANLCRTILSMCNGRETARNACVNSLWNEVTKDLCAHEFLAQHVGVLGPLMALTTTFSELARYSAVCVRWRAAAHNEFRFWREQVLSAQLQRSISPSSDLPFVDKTALLSSRFGLELMYCGGVVGAIRRACIGLGLMGHLDERDRAMLTLQGKSELTMIIRSTPEALSESVQVAGADVLSGNNEPDEDGEAGPLVLVASLQRISPRIVRIVDMLIDGLDLQPRM